MKKNVLTCCVFYPLLLAFLLTGCGSSASSARADYPAESAKIYAPEEQAVFAAEEMADQSENMEELLPESTDRKLIRNISVTAETENLSEFDVFLENRVNALGGYIQSVNKYGRRGYYHSGEAVPEEAPDGWDSASYTLRIPSEKLDGFTDDLEENTNILSFYSTTEDITLQYVDTESRRNALREEEKRLLELVKQAQTVEELITLEDRLSDIRYQMESIESRLKSMDNQVSYSTVELSVEQVRTYTPVKKLGTAERISRGLRQNMENVLVGLREFFIWFIITLPYLAVWAAVILVMLLILLVLNKAGKKHREKKRLKWEAKQKMQNGQQMKQADREMDNTPGE